MKVVIDTNVLVSAAMRDRSPEDVVHFVMHQPDITWVAAAEIVAEYKQILKRPKLKLTDDVVETWCEIVDTFASLVVPVQTIAFPRDRKDAKFLDCAAAARADYLITGDRDFESAPPGFTTKIISVSDFKRTFCADE